MESEISNETNPAIMGAINQYILKSFVDHEPDDDIRICDIFKNGDITSFGLDNEKFYQIKTTTDRARSSRSMHTDIGLYNYRCFIETFPGGLTDINFTETTPPQPQSSQVPSVELKGKQKILVESMLNKNLFTNINDIEDNIREISFSPHSSDSDSDSDSDYDSDMVYYTKLDYYIILFLLFIVDPKHDYQKGFRKPIPPGYNNNNLKNIIDYLNGIKQNFMDEARETIGDEYNTLENFVDSVWDNSTKTDVNLEKKVLDVLLESLKKPTPKKRKSGEDSEPEVLYEETKNILQELKKSKQRFAALNAPSFPCFWLDSEKRVFGMGSYDDTCKGTIGSLIDGAEGGKCGNIKSILTNDTAEFGNINIKIGYDRNNYVHFFSQMILVDADGNDIRLNDENKLTDDQSYTAYYILNINRNIDNNPVNTRFMYKIIQHESFNNTSIEVNKELVPDYFNGINAERGGVVIGRKLIECEANFGYFMNSNNRDVDIIQINRKAMCDFLQYFVGIFNCYPRDEYHIDEKVIYNEDEHFPFTAIHGERPATALQTFMMNKAFNYKHDDNFVNNEIFNQYAHAVYSSGNKQDTHVMTNCEGIVALINEKSVDNVVKKKKKGGGKQIGGGCITDLFGRCVNIFNRGSRVGEGQVPGQGQGQVPGQGQGQREGQVPGQGQGQVPGQEPDQDSSGDTEIKGINYRLEKLDSDDVNDVYNILVDFFYDITLFKVTKEQLKEYNNLVSEEVVVDEKVEEASSLLVEAGVPDGTGEADKKEAATLDGVEVDKPVFNSRPGTADTDPASSTKDSNSDPESGGSLIKKSTRKRNIQKNNKTKRRKPKVNRKHNTTQYRKQKTRKRKNNKNNNKNGK